MVAGPVIDAAHTRLTVFARWRQYARPSNAKIPGLIPLTTQTAYRSSEPFFHNTRLLPTDRPTQKPTDRQNGHGTQPE